jgi:flagellin
MRIMHNLASLSVYKTYTKALDKESEASSRISSGLKIASSKDNPNVIAQSEKIRMQIRGLQMAGRNEQDGVSMLQTAEGGLDNITQMLQRIRELTVQQQNGTNNDGDKQTIEMEKTQLLDGIKDIANNTEFNGVKLLNNSLTADNENPSVISMPIGANVGENAAIPLYNLNNLNMNMDDLDSIDTSAKSVLSMRTKYGALENRFESSLQNTDEIENRMEDADSSLRDADISEEMMNYAKNSILIQAGNAIMVQTNKFPQDILQILQNVKSR